MNKIGGMVLCFALPCCTGHSAQPGVQSREQSKICVELAKRLDEKQGSRLPAVVTLSAQFRLKDAENVRVDDLRRFALEKQQNVLSSLKDSLGELEDLRSFWIVNAIALRAPPSTLRRLAEREDVTCVCLPGQAILERLDRSPDRVPKARCAPHYKDHLELLQSEFPHLKGDGIVVALVDSGIRPDHPDLAHNHNLWKNNGETLGDLQDDDDNGYQDDFYGYDFLKCAVDLCDGLGNCSATAPPTDRSCSYTAPWGAWSHGTLVAGRIVKKGFGFAPEAKLMSLRVLADDRELSEIASWHALEYAITEGADIVNLSLGFTKDEFPSRRNWRTIVTNAQSLGVILVAAAGNDGDQFDNRSIRTPGDVPEIITVGSVDSNGAPGTTSHGPVDWFQQKIPKPDLVAIGDQVCTLGWDGNKPMSAVVRSGTSLAAPVVSGALALMLQAWPQMTPEKAKDCLRAATDCSSWSPTIVGQGRLNVVNAIKKAISASSGTPCDRDPPCFPQ